MKNTISCRKSKRFAKKILSSFLILSLASLQILPYAKAESAQLPQDPFVPARESEIASTYLQGQVQKPNGPVPIMPSRNDGEQRTASERGTISSVDFLQNDFPLSRPEESEIASTYLQGQVQKPNGPVPIMPSRSDDQRPSLRAPQEAKQSRSEIASTLPRTPSRNDELNHYEYDRYEFEDALDLLRPEYASAAIVKSLSEKNLRDLTRLSFETGIIVLHGEIVLFTSGSPDEIGTMPAVNKLLEKASFISHTHPTEHSHEGPSGLDINQAVSTEEYVITESGVHAYNNMGLLNEEPYSYQWYLDRLGQARSEIASTYLQGQVQKPNGPVPIMSSRNDVAARADLNQFILEQDRYNQEATDAERTLFRMGGTVSYTPGLTYASVTTLAGYPFPYLTQGSSAPTSLSFNLDTRFQLNYDVTSTGSISGMTVSFDNASTDAIETQSISSLTYLTFGLKGTASAIKAEFVDINGNKDYYTLTGISSATELFWQISTSTLLSTIDKTRIKQINFIVDQSTTTATTRTGSVYLYAKGLNTNSPYQPVVTSVVPTVTKQSSVTVSGTKQANTSILINGVTVVPSNSATTWSAVLNLATEGNNTFNLTAKSAIGKISTAKTLTIRKDTVAPTGSITINSGASFTRSLGVTLNLSSFDSGSGTSKMSFSTNNVAWSAAESFAPSKAFSLPSGDGTKTVYVKFFDLAGNASAVYSKSITLDTIIPTGSININAGAAYTNSAAVTLSLSASDTASGIDKMSFLINSVWTAPEAYASSKSFTLPGGTGTKTVYVKYYDKAGNVSIAYSKSIILDTTLPTGSININYGALYALTSTVTLNLSATDIGSGVAKMSFSTDGLTYSALEAYVTAKSFTLPSGDGSKKVYVKYYDKAGNMSVAYFKMITLDTFPPSGTVQVNGGAQFIKQTAVTLNLSAQDAGSGLSKMSFSANNSTWTTAENYAATKAWTFAAGNGNKTVWVKFQDKSGRWSALVSVTVLLDTVVPTGSFDINSNAAYTNSPSVTLNLSATDTGSGINQMSFSTDNSTWTAPEAYAATKNFNLPNSDGSKTVYVKYYDKAGNASAVYSKSIVLDRTPPRIMFTSPAGSSDLVYHLNYTVDGTPYEELRILEHEGENVLSVTKTDAAGNTARETWAVFLDVPDSEAGEAAAFTMTTQNGELLKYLDGELSQIELSDGSQLSGLVLNETGDLLSGDLTLSDGSIQILENGKILGYRKSDGSQIFYANGEIQKAVSKDGVLTVYSYLKDANGVVTQTTLEDDRFKSVYDAANKLKESFHKQTRILTKYINGLISEIIHPDGTHVTYTQTVENGYLVLRPTTQAPLSYVDYLALKYDPVTLELKEAQDDQGRVLIFENGFLKSTTDSLGNPVTFAFDESIYSNVLNAQITRNGLTSTYDAAGRLSEVKLDDLRVHYLTDSDDIDYIEKSDGTELYDLVFDAEGKVTGAKIVDPDGNVRVYANGELIQTISFDQTEIFFDRGQITTLVTPDLLKYNFNYTPQAIVASLDSSIVPPAHAVVQIEYAENLSLKTIIKQNREIIRFLDDKPFRIETLNEEVKLYSYERDANGKVLSTKITQGNLETYLAANDQPVRSIIHPTAENPKTLEVFYKYGKIREVYKDNVLTFKYSYSFDQQGKENTVIEDLEEHITKIYQDELLLTSLHQETSVLSSYSYANDKVSEVKVSRLGRTLHAYHYSYQGNNTIVTDEENVVRTYDQKSKLIFLDKDNQKFSYGYFLNDEGKEIIEERLIQRKFRDGSVAHYDEFGATISVDLIDGSKLTDIIFDSDRNITQASITLPSGVKKVFKENEILSEVRPDGSRIDYEDNRISKLTDSQGAESLYQYELKDGETESAKVTSNGYGLNFDSLGNLLGIKVKGLDDGIDGSTDFIDSSLSNHPLTHYGSAELDTDQTKFGAASARFDGTSPYDYLSAPDHADFDFGSGDFTLDAWVKFDSVGFFCIGSKYVNPTGWIFTINNSNNTMTMYDSAGSQRSVTASAFNVNTWYHVAVVRNGSKLLFYKDGVLQGVSQDAALTYNGGGTVLKIGAYDNVASGAFDGWIDELRISKGKARWTSGFTPSQVAYSADSNTQLLLHFDGIDDSYYSVAKDTDPHGNVTGYTFQGHQGLFQFDPNAHLISAPPLSEDVTVKIQGGLQTYLELPPDGYRNGFQNEVLTEVRPDGTQIDYDENLISKVIDPSGIQSRYQYDFDLEGSINAAHVTTETQRLDFDSEGNLLRIGVSGIPDGIDGSTDFIDSSLSNHTLTHYGSAELDTDQTKFGAASARFDGTAPYDYLSAPDHADFDFGTGDFTLDAWVKFDSMEYFCIGSKYVNPTGWIFTINNSNNTMTMYDSAGSQRTVTASAFNVNTWYYVAVVRAANKLSFYKDGVLQGVSQDAALTYNGGGTVLKIGAYDNVASGAFDGWIDELRISKGKARWTSGFTPSQVAYSADSNTQLLLHFDGIDDSYYSVAKDSSSYSLQGNLGTFTYDLSGNVLTQPDAFAGAKIQDALESYLKMPTAGYVNGFVRKRLDVWDWFGQLEKSILAPDTVVSQEYSTDGVLETQTKADKTVTLFENNKPTMVLDDKGSVLIEYRYDEAGNPVRIFLKHARDALPDEVTKAKARVEEERQKALLQIVEAKALAYQQIKSQADSIRSQLSSQISNIQSQINQLENTKVRGSKNKKAKSHALDDGRSVLNQAWGQWNDLHAQEADAYAALDAEAQAASDKVEADSAAAFTEIARQETELKKEILRQEVSPIVYHYYRTILGRDPNQTEYSDWVNQIDYAAGDENVEAVTLTGVTLTQALKDSLNTSAELIERQAYVAQVKQNVTSLVSQYLAMSDSGRMAYAASLGLNPSPQPSPTGGEGESLLPSPLVGEGQDGGIINLTASDAAKILTWLNSRPLHFGQSAFLALEFLLEHAGIHELSSPLMGEDQGGGVGYLRTELATRAIMIDILSGVISPLDEGDLVLSIYALNKTASFYGLTLAGAKLTYEDLRVILNPSSVILSSEGEGSQVLDSSALPQNDRKIIAHISGNHFVVVTNVTETTVTYLDTGIGRDKENEVITVTKEGFLKEWKGYVTGDAALIKDVILSASEGSQDSIIADNSSVIPAEAGIHASHLLTTAESQSVRGAFWGSMLEFFGDAVSILAVIPPLTPFFAPLAFGFALANVITSIVQGDWMSAISAGVQLAFAGFNLAGLYGGTFSGVSNAFGGVGKFFSGLFQPVVGFFGKFVPTLSSFLSGPLGLSSVLATNISEFAVSTGLNYGISKGLDMIGVPVQLSNTISSFATGTILGANTKLTDLQIAKGITQTDLIKSNILTTVTINDIGTLGLNLGLNPTLASIVALSVGAISGQTITNPQTSLQQAFKNVLPDLVNTAALYGISALGSSIGLDPRISSLASVPLASTLSGLVGNLVAPSGGGGPGSIWNTVKNSITNSQTLGGLISVGANIGLDAIGAPPILQTFLPSLINGFVSNAGGTTTGNNLFNKIANNIAKFGGGLVSALGNAISFGAKVLEGVGSLTKAGFAKAGEFFSGIFDRKTIEDLTQGGTRTIESALNSHCSTITDGIHCAYQSVTIDYSKTIDRLSYSNSGTNATFDGLNKIGEFFGGSIAFADELQDGIKVDSRFIEGEVMDIEVVDPNKLKFRIIRVNPGEEVLPISMTDEGLFYNVPIRGTEHYFSFTGNGFWNDPAVDKTGIADLSKRFISDITQDRLLAGEVPIPLLDRNGNVARDREGNVLTANSLPLTLYEETNFGIVGNSAIWGFEFSGGTPLSGKLEQELRSYFDLIEYNKQQYGLQDDQFNYIHFAHSGNFMPMLKALDRNPNMSIKTLISYEGPDLIDRTIHNPNLERVIQVKGTQSNWDYNLEGFSFGGATGLIETIEFGPPFLEFRNYKGVDALGNERNIQNVHIEILGARHNDFDYHPNDPDPIFREISLKSNLFMRELQRVSVNEVRLSAFLDSGRAGITYDKNRSVYVVDPSKYEPEGAQS